MRFRCTPQGGPDQLLLLLLLTVLHTAGQVTASSHTAGQVAAGSVCSHTVSSVSSWYCILQGRLLPTVTLQGRLLPAVLVTTLQGRLLLAVLVAALVTSLQDRLLSAVCTVIVGPGTHNSVSDLTTGQVTVGSEFSHIVGSVTNCSDHTCRTGYCRQCGGSYC